MTGPGNRCLLAVLISTLLIPGTHATAADATSANKKALGVELAETRAMMRSLQQRVDQLEKRLDATTEPQSDPSPPAQTSSAPTAPASTASSPSVPSTDASAEGAPAQAAAATPPNRSAKPAPGRVEIDPETAQRALERTLTQTGALLLPQGTFEFTPSFTYVRNEQNIGVLATFNNPETGTPVTTLANQENRRDESTLRLGLRYGLPFNAQIEMELPVNHVRATRFNQLGVESRTRATGIGDISLGVAKTLRREKGWRPDMVGRINYEFGNGKREAGGEALGGGFRQLQGELLALWRQDPLAFTVGASYSKVFSRDGFTPGDNVGISFGTMLAASQATTLSLGFTQLYKEKEKLNGVKTPGSQQTFGILNLGATSVLSQDVTLVTNVAIGMGDGAPEYGISFALPILFR